VYARLVGRNLKQNPLLQSPTDQICIDTALTALDSASDDAVLDQLWKDQTISIRAKLDSAADKVIAESNAKITIGVAASQSSAIDALIQLYGMWQLTFKIVKVYWTRPGLMVLVQLSRDIIASSAHLFTVSMATESALFQRVIQGAGRLVQRGGQIVAASGEPISGVVATGLGQLIATVGDDAAQAAISRHRTRVYGQGVKARCTAIEWNGVQETDSLVDRFVTALKRVKDTEGNEAPAEGDTHDSGTEAEQAFKLLQSLSWEGRKGSQDLRILGVMVDLINEDTPEDKRINLLAQARSEPKVGGVKRMFGLSKKPTTVVGYSKQALGLVVARTKQLQDDPSLFTEEQNALFSKVAAGLKPSEPAFVE
jgi:hypothetical protein